MIFRTRTDYDAGQVHRTRSRTHSEDGTFVELVAETRYDARGLAVEVRSQGLATGATEPAWFSQRTLYDEEGRVLYAGDRFPEGTPAAEITGTLNEYDPAGRVVSVSRVIGLDIEIAAVDPSVDEANRVWLAALSGAPQVIPFTTHLTAYEGSRVRETTDPYGLKTQHTYNPFGEVTQVRRQAVDESGATVWLVTRTVHDSHGRVIYQSDPYMEGSSQQLYGTRTIYDAQGRVSETQRRVGMAIALDQRGRTAVTSPGQVVHRQTTSYDSRGRVIQTMAPDGQITAYEYDHLDRRVAVLGHPVPASTVGLIVPGDPLVRLRSETVNGPDGRVAQEITNIRQYADGSIDRSAQQMVSYEYDAAGNVVTITRSAAGSDLAVVTRGVR